MSSSPSPELKTLRNSRLKAERDRQFAATVARLKRIGALAMLGAAGLVVVGWFAGCNLTNGCQSPVDTTIPSPAGN